MATFLFDEHVFGPIQSRRLGSSLGINLLSVHQKVCNFNCVYCECGLTKKVVKEPHVFVAYDEFVMLLDEKLGHCKSEGIPIDTITFAGNGEPTMHPDFIKIVETVIDRRDKMFPNAKVAVLTNGYTLDKDYAKEGLSKVDKAIIKVDTGTTELLNLIDQPKGHFTIEKLIQNIQGFSKHPIIQSMFLKGTVHGVSFDNSTGEALERWLDVIEKITPSEVMLYSLDRDTPIESLEVVPKERLKEIAAKVESMGIPTIVV